MSDAVAALKAETEDRSSLLDEMRILGTQARAASAHLATAPAAQKEKALRAMAAAIRKNAPAILAANAEDMVGAEARGLSAAMLDRLRLDAGRVEGIAKAVEEIADQADPVGEVMQSWDRPNGLKISRVRVPLGVIGIIYESRPNVTADAGALCVKAGNAVILRGGSESAKSSAAIHACLAEGLEAAGLPADAIQIVPTTDRAAVGILLADMADLVDVIVPRGGKTLVARVQSEARVPVLAHLEGLCHVYVDRAADLEKAEAIAVNAKMRRTGICGAAETLLLDEALPAAAQAKVVTALLNAGCAVRGDETVQTLDSRVEPASEDDWRTEYLEPIIAARVVPGAEGAAAHIRQYGSQHTDSIVTEDTDTAETFLRIVDSAIVLWNASTQFADGGEFGMGAEIGISTGKLHARGPVGAEQLTSFKYVVRGSGQTRP